MGRKRLTREELAADAKAMRRQIKREARRLGPRALLDITALLLAVVVGVSLAEELIYGERFWRDWFDLLLLLGAGVLYAVLRWRRTRARYRHEAARLGAPICVKCRYDLRATPDAAACPECGGAIERDEAKVRPRWLSKGLAVVLALALCFGAAVEITTRFSLRSAMASLVMALGDGLNVPLYTAEPREVEGERVEWTLGSFVWPDDLGPPERHPSGVWVGREEVGVNPPVEPQNCDILPPHAPGGITTDTFGHMTADDALSTRSLTVWDRLFMSDNAFSWAHFEQVYKGLYGGERENIQMQRDGMYMFAAVTNTLDGRGVAEVHVWPWGSEERGCLTFEVFGKDGEDAAHRAIQFMSTLELK